MGWLSSENLKEWGEVTRFQSRLSNLLKRLKRLRNRGGGSVCMPLTSKEASVAIITRVFQLGKNYWLSADSGHGHI